MKKALSLILKSGLTDAEKLELIQLLDPSNQEEQEEDASNIQATIGYLEDRVQDLEDQVNDNTRELENSIGHFLCKDDLGDIEYKLESLEEDCLNAQGLPDEIDDLKDRTDNLEDELKMVKKVVSSALTKIKKEIETLTGRPFEYEDLDLLDNI